MTLSNTLAHIDVIWDSADAVESCWQLGLAYVAVSPYAGEAPCIGFGEAPTTLPHTYIDKVNMTSSSGNLQMLHNSARSLGWPMWRFRPMPFRRNS